MVDTSLLDAILRHIPSLGEEDVRVLHAAWDGGDVHLRRRAWRHGKRILEERDAEDIYRAASDQVQLWVRDHTSGRTGLSYELDQSFRDLGRLDLRIAAAPSLLDAILCALVGDQLDDAERDELMAPWFEATERAVPVSDERMNGDGPADLGR